MKKKPKLVRDQQMVRAAKIKANVLDWFQHADEDSATQVTLQQVCKDVLEETGDPKYDIYPVLSTMVKNGQLVATKQDGKNLYALPTPEKASEESQVKMRRVKIAKPQQSTEARGIKIDFVQSTGRVRITAPAGVTFDFGVVQS